MKYMVILIALMLLAMPFTAGCETDVPVDEPVDEPVDDPVDDPEVETYSAVSTADRFGYVEVEIDVVNGEIVDARVSEFDGFGFLKDYETYANGGELWPYLEESHLALAEWIVEGDTWDVDIFTEATGTSEKARSAARHAMIRAGLEDPVGTEYFDGTFMGVSSMGERDQLGVAWVTIENDEIVDVVLEEAAPDDEGQYAFKDEDYAAGTGYTEFHEAQEEMPGWFIEAQGPDVDIFTEATTSAELWMEAVRNALDAARVN